MESSEESQKGQEDGALKSLRERVKKILDNEIPSTDVGWFGKTPDPREEEIKEKSAAVFSEMLAAFTAISRKTSNNHHDPKEKPGDTKIEKKKKPKAENAVLKARFDLTIEKFLKEVETYERNRGWTRSEEKIRIMNSLAQDIKQTNDSAKFPDLTLYNKLQIIIELARASETELKNTKLNPNVAENILKALLTSMEKIQQSIETTTIIEALPENTLSSSEIASEEDTEEDISEEEGDKETRKTGISNTG